MIKRLLILFCILTLSAPYSFSQVTGREDEKLRTIVRQKGQAEVIIMQPGTDEMEMLSRNVSITSLRNNRVYIFISPLTLDWFLSKRYDYSILERDESKGIAMASDVNHAMQWDKYPTYTQYDSIMRSFASLYPELCTLDTIGTSILGRLLVALRISGTRNPSVVKPRVFLTSSMHGNETAGFVLMLRLSGYLLQNYGVNSNLTNLIDNLEIWINPLANPDGTFRNGNEITDPTRENANGYDLNRNFPDPEVSNNILQKETIEMMKFLSRYRFNLSVNFHSGAEVANYPWDRWSRSHADAAWFYQICRSYADTAHTYSRKGYMTDYDNGVTNGYNWYLIYGGRQDYVTWSLNGREITVELDTNYVSPASDLQILWESNRNSLTGFLENALYGIHGTVTDSYTGKPVPAMIKISGHDIDNSWVYSDTASGNFTRLIYPGLWNLSFSADGYLDTLIQNVSVIDRQPTILSIRMEPIIKPPGLNSDILLFPNPASNILRAIFSDKLRDRIRIRIFNSAGIEVMTFDADSSDGSPAEINISRLTSGTYIIAITNKSTGYTATAKFSSSRKR